MLKRYGKQRFAVTSGEWTPLSCDYACDFFVYRCTTSDLVERTDVNDPGTEDLVPMNIQEGITVGSGSASSIIGLQSAQRVVQSRFLPGEPVCWVKSVQPTAVVILTWVL